MTTRLAVAVAGLALAVLPAAARAATPVQLGSGSQPTVVMTAGNHAHVVWEDPAQHGNVWDYCDLAYGATTCSHTTQLIDPTPAFQSGPTIFRAPFGFEVWGNSLCNGIHAIVRYSFVDGGAATRTCITSATGGGQITPGDAFLDTRPGHDWLLGTGNPAASAAYFHAFNAGDAVPGAQVFDNSGFVIGPSVGESGSAQDGSGSTLAVAGGRTAPDAAGDRIGYAVYQGLVSGASITALNDASNWDGNLFVSGTADVDPTSIHAVSGTPDDEVPIIGAANPTGAAASIVVARVKRPTGTLTPLGITKSSFAAGPSDHAGIGDLEGTYDATNGLNLTWVSGGRLRYAHEVNGTMTLQGTVTPLAGVMASHHVDTNDAGKGYEVYATQGKVMAVPLEATHDSADDPTPPGGGGGDGGSGGGGATTPPGGGAGQQGGATSPPATNAAPQQGSPTGSGAADTAGSGTGGPTTAAVKHTTTKLSDGGSISFGTPTACVSRGKTFTATLGFTRSKRKGAVFVKVSRVAFSIAGQPVKTDKRAPFRQTLRVTPTATSGATVTVRARATIKVHHGRSPKKSVVAKVRVC